MTKKKAGRPRLDEQTRAKEITIEARHLAFLDAAIERADGHNPDVIRDAAELAEGTFDERRKTVLAKRRRAFLGALIERTCSFEAMHPVAVRVVAPMIAAGPQADVDAAVAEVAEWQRTETARLTAEAPEPVQAAFRHAELERLKRTDPETFKAAMADLRSRLLAGEGAGDD